MHAVTGLAPRCGGARDERSAFRSRARRDRTDAVICATAALSVIVLASAVVSLAGLADELREDAPLRLRRRRALADQRSRASRSTTPGSPAARSSAPA